MAVIRERRFYSESLNHPVTVYEIVPRQVKETMVFLHGYNTKAEECLEKMHLKAVAERYGIRFLLPQGDNSFYMDPWRTFLTEELASEFPEGAVLGGISMGGFGALLAGAGASCYHRIACLSGAFIQRDVANGNPEVVGDTAYMSRYFFETFGDFQTLLGSERDPEAVAMEMYRQGKLQPVFLSCGTEDMLYSRNEHVREALKETGLVTWYPVVGGGHFYGCASAGLRQFIRNVWKLPEI